MKFSSSNQPTPAGKTHHNCGRAQHPKTRFSGKLNWYKLQITGAYANLTHSGFSITRDPMFSHLKPEYQERIRNLIIEIRNSTSILKDAIEELSSLNSSEKWNDSD